MLTLTTLAVDGSRVTDDPRSRLFSGTDFELTWGARCDRAGARQAAYQLVWSTESDNGATVLHDTGWVENTRQRARVRHNAWKGQAVKVSLTIRDNRGQVSNTLKTTLYNADVDFFAPWIGLDKDVPKRAVYLRREFVITKPLKSAVLYACGVGYHQLYLNGEPLDDAVLEPAYTDYSKTCQYVTYPLLHEKLGMGTYCLAAMVGDGWRRNSMVEASRYPDRPEGIPFAGPPMFSLQMHLTYQDGTKGTLVTDQSWQAGDGMLWENDLFNGETWDANRARRGWNLPGFDGFQAAKELPGPGGERKPMLIPPIKAGEVHRPLAMWPLGQATVIDFGHNLAGVIRLRLPEGMDNGQVIRVLHAEELDEDGDLFMEPLRGAKATDTYIASGDDRDLTVWQPMFTYHGFRYARVEGMALAKEDITAVSLHTDLDTDSFFRCGDALVTRIHEICVATERANQHSILTDCPQRDERMGWMNDATVRFEQTPYNFDIGRMFPKVVRDIIDTQDKNGAITCTAPYVFGGRPAAPVSSSFLVAAWQHYLFTGSLDLVREGFPNFERWQECLMRASDDHIVNYSRYGDWASPADCCVDMEGAHSALTPGIFMSTGYSYYNCVMLSRMAQAMGDEAQVDWWQGRADEIRAAMLNKWYNPATATMASGSQACQAFALWLGIIPAGDAPRAAQVIVEDLAQRGHRITTGNLCTRYLMDALCDHGHVDDAWRLMTRQTYPSWGYMLQNEATTIWERFELKKHPGMNSHSHPMYGAVDGWLYAYIAGIKPMGPGFARYQVKPYMPTSLLSCQASVDTVMGDVAVRWMKRYDAAHLHVTVPFGAVAEVHFGGKVQEVPAGFHAFEAPWVQGELADK